MQRTQPARRLGYLRAVWMLWQSLAFWLKQLFQSPLLPLASLGYLIILGFNILIMLAPPQLMLVLAASPSDNARIQWTVPGGVLWEQGVRAGDRVVSLEQQSPQAQQDTGLWFGQSLTVQTAQGKLMTFTAEMLRAGRNMWLLLMISPWFFWFGVLVHIRAQPRAVGTATFNLFTVTGLALAMGAGAVNEQPLMIGLEFVVVTLFAAYFLRFFMTFPITRGSVRAHRLLMVAPLITCLLGLASLLYVPLYLVAVWLRAVILVLYLALGIGFLVHSLVRATQPEMQRGMIILSIGTGVSVLPFLLLYLLPLLLDRTPFLAAEQAILALIILPVSFSYAILRHNVLNIALIQRWFVHSLLGVVLLIQYTIVFAVLSWLLGPFPTRLQNLLLIMTLVLIVGTTFERLYSQLRYWTDRTLFKDNYNYRAALQQLARDLSMARDLNTLGTQLPERLQRLINVRFAVLLIREQHRTYIHAGLGEYSADTIIGLTRASQCDNEPCTLHLLDGESEVLLSPLLVQGIVVGYICLGPKANGERFRIEDRDLLATLSGHVAAIVCTEQLVDMLKSKVDALDTLNERLQSAQEEERSRLSADIHDEPLQTALQLQRVVAQNGVSSPELASLSQALVRQLRDVCTAMLPVTLEYLGLIPALDALAQEQSERANIPITLRVDAAVAELTLTSEADLVLYRAAQEGVNNSLRHAGPKMIQISLRQQDDHIYLLIADDGKGFVVPSQLETLVNQNHLGLAGLQERVRKIQGRMTITSSPDCGTHMQIAIPLKAVIT